MKRLFNYFAGQYDEDSLYQKERVKNVIISSLVVVPSMVLIIPLHIADQMPPPVLIADFIFLLASTLSFYFVRNKQLDVAACTFLSSFVLLVICHNIVTDYLYAVNLSHFRIVETTLMFTLILISSTLLLQRFRAILLMALIGAVCIVVHYWIIISKMGLPPFTTNTFSVLVAYLLVFGGLYVLTDRILRIYRKLLVSVETEAAKVQAYNEELERRVDVRTSELESQNKELKKVNSELDRFVYSASHDLRAPLTSVLGLIQLSKIEEDPNQLMHYLNLKEKSIRKLDNFIQDIVNISKNSRTEVCRDEIHFEELVRGIFEQYDYMHNAQTVNQLIDIKQEQPFIADSYRVNIVLSNLLSNAIRYTNSYQESSYIKVSGKIDDKLALLYVEDNGRGISDKYLDKVFDMFFRADNDKNGSGLGLYIVKETIDKIGGKISVSSTLGKGTIFTIKIPSEKSCQSSETTLVI